MQRRSSALAALSAQRWRRAGSAQSTPPPPRQKWSFAGPFGKYDEAQLQRGFKIYKEVCSTCHAMHAAVVPQSRRAGRPRLLRAQAAALAAEYKIKDLDDQGQPTERAGRPGRLFPGAVRERASRAAATTRTSARHVDACQGARYERGFPWFVFDISRNIRSRGPTTSRRSLQGYENAPPAGLQLPPGTDVQQQYDG